MGPKSSAPYRPTVTAMRAPMPTGATQRMPSTSFRKRAAKAAYAFRNRSREGVGRKSVAMPRKTATTTSWATFPSVNAWKMFVGISWTRISATPGTAPMASSTSPVRVIPTNVFQAFAEGNVAQLVVVAVLLGITTLFLPPEPRDMLRNGYAALAALFRKLVDGILWVAPLGIGALMAVTVGRYGSELFGPMARFLLGVWGTQLLMFGAYMVLLVLLTDRRPWTFLKGTGPLWATTVATTSSLASLSVALEMAEKIKLPRSVYSFTLPLGAQINKDGTSIMLAAVLVFTAQAAGVAFTLPQMVTILLVGLLLSEGSGGIPGGGLVIALIFVQAFNLPLEVAVIVGGIYRLVDMGNTPINVMGDMVGTAIVSHSEGMRSVGEGAV